MVYTQVIKQKLLVSMSSFVFVHLSVHSFLLLSSFLFLTSNNDIESSSFLSYLNLIGEYGLVSSLQVNLFFFPNTDLQV